MEYGFVLLVGFLLLPFLFLMDKLNTIMLGECRVVKQVRNIWIVMKFVLLLIFIQTGTGFEQDVTRIMLLLFVLILVELLALYRDQFMNIFFMTSAYLLNITVIINLITLFWHKAFRQSVVIDFTNTAITYPAMVLMFLIMDLAIAALILFFPVQKISQTLLYNKQRIYMILWMFISWLYLLLDDYSWENIPLNQGDILNIAAKNIILLGGGYLLLLTNMVLARYYPYVKKSMELEKNLSKEGRFKKSMMESLLMYFEVDLVEGTLLETSEETREIIGNRNKSYDTACEYINGLYIREKDQSSFRTFFAREHLLKQYQAGNHELSFECQLQEEKNHAWIRVNVSFSEEKEELLAFFTARNVDDEKKKMFQLKNQAETDFLSGLCNKGTTQEKIDVYLAAANVSKKESVLLILDIDNFKQVNDSLGHIEGDKLIQALASEMKSLFREDDIVGRIGGDEFIIFVKNCAYGKIVEDKITRLLQNCNRRLVGEDKKEVNVSCSIGIAIAPMHGVTYLELYQKADEALYVCKNMGKNQYHVYGK